MLEPGGFNEALYPNEENALMDELQKRGGKPYTIRNSRAPPATIQPQSFAKMLMTTGGAGRSSSACTPPRARPAPRVLLFCPDLLGLPSRTCWH